MAIQDFFRWDDLDIEVSCVMSVTPGESADIGQIVTRATETQPTNYIGDLKLMRDTDGTVTTLRTWTNCILQNPRLSLSQSEINFTYQVKDRRRMWEHPFVVPVFGRYNVRDEDGEIESGTAKNPRELATILLEALNETGYSVSILPTDADLAPEVNWHYASAAIELGKLVRLYGCSIHLLTDNTIAIKQDGSGTVPTDTGLMEEPEQGLTTDVVPDYIRAYAGDTIFDSWLTLEPVGMEVNGDIKHIDLLSYRPTGGWKKYHPVFDSEMTCIEAGISALSEELKEKTREVARRSVFKMYRVIGLGPRMETFPSIEDEVGYFNDSATWAVVRITIDSDGIPGYTNVASEADYDDAVDEFRTVSSANPNNRYVIAPPNTVVFDIRHILPLEQRRAAYGSNKFVDRKERSIPEITGRYTVWMSMPIQQRYGYTAEISDQLRAWKFGLSLDTNTGIVTLGVPAYRWTPDIAATEAINEARIDPPFLYLRTGYRLRLTPFGNVYHRAYRKASGGSLGTPDSIIPRTDIHQVVIQQYTDDYEDIETLSTVTDNAADIDTILENTATQDLNRYINRPQPQKRVYTPSLVVNTDGVVNQITYECAVGRPAKTTVSIGGEFDFGQPPAFQRRKQIQELKDLEDKNKRFVSEEDQLINKVLNAANPMAFNPF